MTVLLLRLAGPLQSWGDSSRFTTRATRREPTKSGVIGLLAAAQGRRRTDSLEDLLTLRFGVRTDQPGSIVRDFQTAMDWAHPKKDGRVKAMPLSNRYYVADAVFVAAVEGDPSLLQALDEAIRDPEFPLYLGRRSCPTEGQVSLGVRESELVKTLEDEPWHAKLRHQRRLGRSVRLPIAYDAGPGQIGDTVRDIPLSFNPERREYGWRDVTTTTIVVDNPNGSDEPDWFAGLEGA